MASAAVAALVACAPHPPVSSPEALAATPSRQSWDGSQLVTAGGRALVFAGPVLHRADASAPSGAISKRCFALARGIPDLVPSEVARRSPSDTDALFTAQWPAEVALARDLCSEAYGAEWRLPSVAEATAVFSPYDAALGWRTVLVREASGAVRALKRKTAICAPAALACGHEVRLSLEAPQQSEVYCVGPAEHAPPTAASRAELAGCIERLDTLWADRDPVPADELDEGALDFVLAARRACAAREPNVAELVQRVRAELGQATLRTRSAELALAMTSAREHLEAVEVALRAIAPPLSVDCEQAPLDYVRLCRTDARQGSCPAMQAAFVSACLGVDPAPRLEALASELGGRVAGLELAGRRQRTVERAVTRAMDCARPRGADAPLRELFGPRPRLRPTLRACTPADLDCLLAALSDDGAS
jgi:hypothetical protein